LITAGRSLRKSDYTHIKVGESYTPAGTWIKTVLTIRAYSCNIGAVRDIQQKFNLDLTKKEGLTVTVNGNQMQKEALSR
jgi:hypothetical protein